MDKEPAVGTQGVTPAVVREWAEDAIAGWMTGYTDFDEDLFQQFKVTRLKDGTYEVTTLDPEHPDSKRFHVQAFVVPAP